MPHASNHDVELYYESFGEPADPALVLVAGHGVQLLAWPDELCWAFVDRGFRVVRFDNRDAGWSTVMTDAPDYTLSDMAADTVAVMDAAGIDRAHLVGMSMGGMIAQHVAIEHRDRVLTLVSMASTTGELDAGQPSLGALDHLAVEPAAAREAVVAHSVAGRRIWGSRRWFDEAASRAEYEAAFDRAFHPGAGIRQFHAIVASGSRAEGLAALDLPTLVVHADTDLLVDRSGGERTAELVPGAELVIIEDMGHQLPVQVWSQLVEAITAHVMRAEVAGQ